MTPLQLAFKRNRVEMVSLLTNAAAERGRSTLRPISSRIFAPVFAAPQSITNRGLLFYRASSLKIYHPSRFLRSPR